jgi:hypothetical protein
MYKQFISKTFNYARMNMRINGRNLEDMDEDEEGTMDSILSEIIVLTQVL